MSRIPWIPALFAGLLFFGLGTLFLEHGQPHEDAYIQFKYARMWAAGHGIAYYPGGPPAEGSTDFGWLALLAAAVRLGLSAPWAALCVSSLAAALAASLLGTAAGWRERSRSERLLIGLAAIGVVVSPAAHASFVGFSTLFFASVCVLGLHLYMVESWRGSVTLPLLGLPLVGLAAGLVRPEGLAVGVGLALLGLQSARRLGALRGYACSAAAALVLGAIYFGWRSSYFDTALPLPLYVKSHADALLPGLESNLAWLAHRAPRLGALLVLVLAVRQRFTDPVLRRLAAGALPFGLLFVLLAFGQHIQDVGDRFHAPLLLALTYGLFATLARPAASRWRLAVFALLIGGIGLRDARSLYRYIWAPATQGEYIDSFAFRAATCLGAGDRVALTEAGRMAYWHEAEVVDLVGLNTAAFARSAPSVSDLAEYAPDLVLLHEDWTLDTTGFARDDGTLPKIVKLERAPAELLGPDQPTLAQVESEGGRSYAELDQHNVRRAAVVGIHFLSEHFGEYDVFLLHYGGRMGHLVGVRRGFEGAACLRAALDSSLRERPSWIQLQQQLP